MAKIRVVERNDKGQYRSNKAMTRDEFRKELKRPRYITIVIVVLVLAVGYFTLRKPVQQVSGVAGTIGQVHSILGYSEKMVDMYGEVSDELRRIQAQNNALKDAIAESNSRISSLEEKVVRYAENASQDAVKIDSLLALVTYPDYEVETFEECLEELGKAEITICYLDEVVLTQSGKIETLKSISVTKDMIIYEKTYIIEKQDEQIANYTDYIRALNRRNRIKNGIYTAVGIAIGVFLL